MAKFIKGQTAYLVREFAKEVQVKTVVVKACGAKVATLEGFSNHSVDLVNKPTTLFATVQEAMALAETLANRRSVPVVQA